MMQKIKVLIDIGKYNGALELLDLQIQKDPKDVEGYLLKGDVLKKLKKYAQALEAYEEAVRLDYSVRTLSEKAFILYLYLERYEEAIKCYDLCLAIDPSYSHGYFYKGKCLIELSRFDEALESYEKAIMFETDSAFSLDYVIGVKKALYEQGTYLLKREKYTEALETYKKAKEISFGEPYNVTPADYAATANEANDPYIEVREELIKYDRFSQIGIADCFYDQGDYLRALAQYPNFTAASNTVEAVIRKAYCYMEKGHPLNAYWGFRLAQENKFDVSRPLQYLNEQFPLELRRHDRDAEATLAVIKEITEYYLQTSVNRQDEIEASLYLFKNSLLKADEASDFEEAFNSRHLADDDALHAFIHAAMLLIKFKIAPHVYRSWVWEQDASIHNYLMRLDLLSSGAEDLPVPLQVPLYFEATESSRQPSPSLIEGFVRSGFIRLGNRLWTDTEHVVTVQGITMNGLPVEVAFEGDTVQLDIQFPSPMEQSPVYLFKERFHRYLWISHELLDGEQDTKELFERFGVREMDRNFPKIGKNMQLFQDWIRRQEQEACTFKGTVYASQQEATVAMIRDQFQHQRVETAATSLHQQEMEKNIDINNNTFDSYKGETYQHKRHGKGTYTWADGSKYSGDWLNDARSGKGRYIDSSGRKYMGYWKNDMMHGTGSYTDYDGTIYEGNYNENHPAGTFTRQFLNGEKQVGSWVDGTFVANRTDSEQPNPVSDQAAYRVEPVATAYGDVYFDESRVPTDRTVEFHISEIKRLFDGSSFLMGRLEKGNLRAGDILDTDHQQAFAVSRIQYNQTLVNEATADNVLSIVLPGVDPEQLDGAKCLFREKVTTASTNRKVSYAGEVAANQANGSGSMTLPGGLVLCGQFKNNLPVGEGTLTYPNGDKLESFYDGGKITGASKIHFSSGGSYEGELDEDLKPHGQGTLTTDGGSVLSGEFNHNDFVQGKVSLLHKDGRIYKGDLTGTQYHGYGIMQYPDGGIYEGSWLHGKRNGHGVFTDSSNNKMEGNWEDDQPTFPVDDRYRAILQYVEALKKDADVYEDVNIIIQVNEIPNKNLARYVHTTREVQVEDILVFYENGVDTIGFVVTMDSIHMHKDGVCKSLPIREMGRPPEMKGIFNTDIVIKSMDGQKYTLACKGKKVPQKLWELITMIYQRAIKQ